MAKKKLFPVYIGTMLFIECNITIQIHNNEVLTIFYYRIKNACNNDIK